MTDALSSAVFIALAILFLFWGTVQTLSLKWADTIDASDGFTGPTSGQGGSHAVHFRLLYSFAHPFTQAFFMFCAETSCLVMLVCTLVWKKYVAPRLYDSRKATTAAPSGELVAGEDYALPCNPSLWLLPSGADFLASIVQNVGLTLTYASVYQMLCGSTVVWIALISHFWLGYRFTKVELWGMGCVVLGVFLVGLSNLLERGLDFESTSHGRQKNQVLGNLLVLMAQILHAYQGVCEERLIRLYKVPSLQMVGTEGIYGIGMSLSLLAFLQLVPMATWGHNLAAVEEFLSSGGPGVLHTNVTWVQQLQPALKVPYDDVVLAFAQIRESLECKVFILVYLLSGFFYNACHMSVIKYVSATATVMIGSLRNVTVWLVCLLIPSVFEEHFNVVQLIGFVFLVLGNVLFHRICITRFDAILPAQVIDACPVLFRDARKDREDVVKVETRIRDTSLEPQVREMRPKEG
ncbi:EamA-like transporter family [Leishmania donovani]|uniref:EamA-like transporter family protein n=1 Tax=Leishmania donovani TaxID=5661 RepID=A0A504X8D4_LEIDO|nr:EamA-like transporter family protein [Leishmania donovani]CAJ1993431.1 EamA-like transporter family [Leishmania donovani]VDZ49257.1 EamA-like_transporter_family_putative/Pfam:PF00892 [Leishmania donovani]